MKYQTIIFDWSGTISDDRIPVYEANRVILKRYKKEIPPIEQFLSQTVGTFQEFARSLGIDEDVETLSRLYAEAYERITNSGTTPILFCDVHNSVNTLRNNNFDLAVLSSHPQKSLEKEAVNYKIREYFTILRGDSRNKTRDLSTLCKRLSFFPSKTIYLGDMVQDIKAAKLSGLQSAVITTGYHSREKLLRENPSIGVFNTLEEFYVVIIGHLNK